MAFIDLSKNVKMQKGIVNKVLSQEITFNFLIDNFMIMLYIFITLIFHVFHDFNHDYST